MAVINRVLSQSFLESFKLDFKNLIRIVNDSHGELDLAIRDNYLNLLGLTQLKNSMLNF